MRQLSALSPQYWLISEYDLCPHDWFRYRRPDHSLELNVHVVIDAVTDRIYDRDENVNLRDRSWSDIQIIKQSTW